jgi:hypothetical protein
MIPRLLNSDEYLDYSAQLVGMDFTFEHFADATRHGHVMPTAAPQLTYRKR